jgi:hypothetical protein
MHDLSKHPYFERWQDPSSGTESFVLKERVAAHQQSFYFVNPSVSADEEWLWFYTAFPPNLQRSLGVVSLDPATPFIKHFPEAGFTGTSPLVAPEGNAVYFCMGPSVYKLNVDGQVREICTMSKERIAYRHSARLATHLTLSVDGKYLLLDSDLGNFWWVGLGDVETGEITVLDEFCEHHDHAQFSPTDPDLFLIPQDHWNDKISGHRFHLKHRLWLMDTGQTRYEPVHSKEWYDHNSQITHEWWSRDGLVCWVDYRRGTYECDPYTFETSHVCERALCHAHCSSDRRYWCADENPYKWATQPVEILFYDRKTKQETAIVSAMPAPPVAENLYKLDPPYCPRDLYHHDPHPQFSPRDSWVVYTSTVRGQVDVALCPVPQLETDP